MKRCHGKSIEADYQIQFGAPRLVRRGVTVRALLDCLFAGGREELRRAWNLTDREIKTVADYLGNLIDNDGEAALADAYWAGKEMTQDPG